MNVKYSHKKNVVKRLDYQHHRKSQKKNLVFLCSLGQKHMYIPASQAITGYLMYHLYAVLPASIPQEKENVHEEGKKV